MPQLGEQDVSIHTFSEGRYVRVKVKEWRVVRKSGTSRGEPHVRSCVSCGAKTASFFGHLRLSVTGTTD